LLNLTREFFSQKDARKSFLNHISKNSIILKFGIILGLFLSDFPLIKKMPILNQIVLLSKSLWAGHLTEINFGITKLNKTKILVQPSKVINMIETFDYIVIGSGPGSVSAVSNIPSASSILVIEKGKFSQTPQSAYHTLSHISDDFEKSGQEFVFSFPFSQFAQGSVVGGGSEVNSGLYHRMPDIKIAEYLKILNLNINEWEESQNWVENLLNVNAVELDSKLSVIARGALLTGLEFKNVPRWRTYTSEANFVHHGMNNVFWKYFEKIAPARVLKTEMEVTKIESGKQIKIFCRDKNGAEFMYTSRKLILGAGAIGTPNLLASSKLIKWSDTRFQWHPMVRAIVRTSRKDLGFADIDPFQAWTKGYSIKFGSAVSTPGLLAIGLGREIHNHEFQKLRSYYASFVSTGRGGLIPKSKIPWYKFSKLDRIQLTNAKNMLEKIIVNSGASFADSSATIKNGISTVHVFGTLPSNSPVYIKGTNRLKVNPNILICDSSILPFGPGVNPQGIIMTTIKSMTKILRYEID